MEGGSKIDIMSKRSKGFPSSAHVTIGGGETRFGEEFLEKLGRNDPCPCGSDKRFKNCHMREKASPLKIGDDYSRER